MTLLKYHKVPIISPGIIFVQKAFLLGLFSGNLFSEGLTIGRNFAFFKWLGIRNENGLKRYESGPKQLALTVHGLIFGRAFAWKDFCV